MKEIYSKIPLDYNSKRKSLEERKQVYSTKSQNLDITLEDSQRDRTKAKDYGLTRLLNQVPKNLREVIYYFLLSDVSNKESVVEEFLKLDIDNETKILANIRNPFVFEIFDKARKVRRQIHKWKGILRFKEIEGGYLYASFTSEFDIIVPLSKHFAERFNTERLLIHDLKRGKAVYIESGAIYNIDFIGAIPQESDGEKVFCEMWKLYFNTIGIKERENRELQDKCLPKKFQEWLCEFGSSERITKNSPNSEQLELF